MVDKYFAVNKIPEEAKSIKEFYNTPEQMINILKKYAMYLDNLNNVLNSKFVRDLKKATNKATVNLNENKDAASAWDDIVNEFLKKYI